MNLVAEQDGNRVMVLEDLETLLEPGSKSVRIEHVTKLLAAVRAAATGLLPPEPLDPVRLEALGVKMRTVADAARTLAQAEGADPAASEAILAALEEFDL